ncbi:MAG: cyclase family protein, partial [Prolixibacteraceae bacterium]|nr:cyclase family protein [Prolixibacteraceae bacterium]
MKLYDLTHPIHKNMPVYPGTPQPSFEKKATIISEGYRETKLEFFSHIGTHVDAPAHMLEDGKFLEQYPVSKFSGKAFIITIPAKTQKIEKKFLEQFHAEITSSEFVLLKTGWYKYWETEKYFRNFPVLST